MKANIDYRLIQDNDDALSLSFKGILNIDEVNDKYNLTYTNEGIKNILEIDNKEKTIRITNQNELFFKKGLDKKIKYKTAYGLIDLRLVTNDLKIDYDKDKKELGINLKYYLYQGKDPLVNDLTIRVDF